MSGVDAWDRDRFGRSGPVSGTAFQPQHEPTRPQSAKAVLRGRCWGIGPTDTTGPAKTTSKPTMSLSQTNVAPPKVAGTEAAKDVDGESEQCERSEDENVPEPTDVAQEDLGQVPLDTMSPAQLRKRFGRQALDVIGAMWQHQSKIGEQARFMQKTISSPL